MHREGHLDDVYWALRIGLGSTAFLAELDKFTNLLTNWDKYIAPQVRDRLPVSGRKFMYGIGVIEMLVGLGILTRKPRLAGYTASAWLLSIACRSDSQRRLRYRCARHQHGFSRPRPGAIGRQPPATPWAGGTWRRRSA